MEKYTWATIQIETIKKMFLNKEDIKTKDLKSMRDNNRYRTYLAGMAQACNEAIGEIVKRTDSVIKTFDLTVQPIINLSSYRQPFFNDGTDDFVVEADRGLSYYFEVDNKAVVELYVGGELTNTINSKKSLPGKFSKYKGYIDNVSNKPIKLVFKGSNPYYIRNVAIYEYDYNPGDGNAKYIPDYSTDYRCDLSLYIKDFYQLEKLYDDNDRLINNTDYFFEDRNTLVLNRPGFYKIKYRAYPMWITTETSDEDTFDLDPELAVLIPLYMASQLYKDDDISIATQYRNEFEAALLKYRSGLSDLKFISKSGWL